MLNVPAALKLPPSLAAAEAVDRAGGGWILGYKIDGTQADFVRVPFADTSTYPVPAGVSDEPPFRRGYERGLRHSKGISQSFEEAVTGEFAHHRR